MHRSAFIVVALLLFGLAGCGKGGLELHEVTGTVKYSDGTVPQGEPGMSTITFTPVNHPNRQVRQVGFDLSDTYVEQCWSAVVGPSAVVLLRRMPELWRHDHTHGILTVSFSGSQATALLRDHDHVRTPLSRLTAAQAFRAALERTRAKNVLATHALDDSGALEVRLRWS